MHQKYRIEELRNQWWQPISRVTAKLEQQSLPVLSCRWLADATGTHDPKSFLAFGAGPRFCPGRNLAFLEAKAAVAMLARNFHVSLDPAAPPVTEVFTFTMAPSGLRVRLRERAAES